MDNKIDFNESRPINTEIKDIEDNDQLKEIANYYYNYGEYY